VCNGVAATAAASNSPPLEHGEISAQRAQLLRRRHRPAQRAAFALLLAAVAGSVDAIGYLTLFQLFIAHMSGNTVRVGIFIGQRDWTSMFQRAFPIPMLVLGVMAGGLLTEVGLRRGFRATLSAILLLECLLLAVFAVYASTVVVLGQVPPSDGWRFYLAVALPAFALGLQNAALRRVGGHTVRTTFVTGMLTDLAEAAVAYAVWLHDQRRCTPNLRLSTLVRRSGQDESFHRFVLYTSIWLMYVAGAVAGTLAKASFGLAGLALPIALLALVSLWNAYRPVLPPEPE